MHIRPRSLAPLALALLALSACGADDGGATSAPSDAWTPPTNAPSARFELTLTLGVFPPGVEVAGRLRLLARTAETDARIMVDLGPVPEVWPATRAVDALPPGRYELTVFVDRDDDAVFDGCGFPPSPDDPDRADALDNVSGQLETIVEDDSALEVRLERHVCGPGDPATGLRGVLEAPVEGVDDPVYLRLESATSCGGAAAAAPAEDAAPVGPAPLRIPLFPAGLSGAQEFDVGQLVPGCYDALFFADADADREPTPCGDSVGGADRFLARLDGVEVVAGVHTPLSGTVALAETAECPAALTGVSGTLALSSALIDLAAREPELAARLLDGAVRVALADPADGAVVMDSFELAPALETDALPRPFTVSGLPTGVWRLTIYLDRDHDGRFSPCGGLRSGLDAVYALHEQVTVSNGSVTELGRVELARRGECAAEPTGFVGSVTVPIEPGPVGSGRPVRLELVPAGGGGERRSLVIFENHAELAGESAPFAMEADLPPGQYRARIYLDGDRDGAWSDCVESPFGDRATTDAFTVSVVPGERTELGARTLVAAGCAVPETRLSLRLLWPVDGPLVPEGLPVRVLLHEAGGWERDFSPDGANDASDLPAELAPLSLAPGAWRVTVYLDTIPDGELGRCGGEAPDGFAATAEVTLDAARPEALLEMTLLAACPP